ncbi:hypothetical protein [Allosphingosinicella deserti]|uniref:Uncharacterized protein n=1 Tax=Allosphingosinicella deserti TaxID=2116704 RepID=A0A2P7QZR6_9SPHN|nr:hypothetical protein [Sphingomonas deserti]PSJ43443.1 hypothetical protein C7I55_03545 [Sphingomonas deserti]
MVIVPLDEQRLDVLAMSEEGPLEGFTYLTATMAGEIAKALNGGRALYIETDYFGGMGGQSAALFESGGLAWTDNESNLTPAPEPSWFSRLVHGQDNQRRKSPISSGLARLGVLPEGDSDEFDRLGLGRFRSLDDLGLGGED